MANAFYNRGASFNPDELADGDAIEAEFDSVGRGFDTIEDLVNANKAGYPTQTFHVATATAGTHAVPKAQMDAALGFKLDAVNYNATDVLRKLKTVDGSGSGVDADLLDGQDGSYYRNATNINAGTLAKERLPASIDASTTGNADTATKVAGAATGTGTADLVTGSMADNDFARMRVGGSASGAGWMEIATADNGDEPIYVRQYTGKFVSVARTLTLLDGAGDTILPGKLKAASSAGGVELYGNNTGIYPGNGNNASSTINNLKLSSWFGIGFGPSISGQTVPLGEYSHWFNVRNGDMDVRGTITATQLNGNAATATKLATARQINGVNFDGTGNITVADNTKLPLAGGNMAGEISFTPLSGTVMSFGATPVIRRFAGANSKSMGVGGDNTLLLGAGESVGIMAANLALGGEDVHIGAETTIFMHVSTDNWATWAGKKTFSIDATNGPLWNGGKVWNAGNDGAGSGLDADLLDGQDGAYYRNASNINAGTIGDAYLPTTISSSITGNAATATTLQTARTINGVSFNGSANIVVEPYIEQDLSTAATRYLTFVDSATAGHQRLNLDTDLTYNPSTNLLGASVSGNAGTATKWATARTITLTTGATGGVSMDGSGNVSLAVTIPPTGHIHALSTISDSPYKEAADVATTAALTVTATATTLTNSGTLAALVLDGVTVTTGMRVLVKDQAAPAQNGLFSATNVGSASVAWVLTRTADADTSAEIAGAVVTVDRGTTHGAGLFTNDFKKTSTLGTTAMNWRPVVDSANISTLHHASGVAAGTYRAVTVNAQGHVVSASNPTTLAEYGITNAQAKDATLTALAAVTTAADKLIYATGADVFSTTTLTAFARSILDDADAAAVRATIGALDASDNIATATKVAGNASGTGFADLVYGVMADNDSFRIRVGGSASDAGWAEIATADGGNEPIYVRQYTGSFTTAARTLTLLDGVGNTYLPGTLYASGHDIGDNGGGIFNGNADGASSTINNVCIRSWFGIGFSPSLSGQSVPQGEYSHWFDVRNGNMGCRGSISAGNGVLKSVAVLSGTIAHGGTIPLPAGFAESQCEWLVSINASNANGNDWDVREGIATNHYGTNCSTSGRVVYATMYAYNDANDSVVTYAATANYIIIGVK